MSAANTLPAIGKPWPGQPGIYAGITTGKTGTVYALLLLADKPEQLLNWHAALKWATGIEADLPTLAESALLFANLKDQFELSPSWHWTSESFDGSCAWFQNFLDGFQFNDHKSYEGRARAVHRLPLDPSMLSVAGGA